jgi:hypothetical protein
LDLRQRRLEDHFIDVVVRGQQRINPAWSEASAEPDYASAPR